MVTYAKSFIGVPYVYGGTDKTGIDCSGLIFTVARESIKLQLPRTVAALYGYVKVIPDNQKEAGDILFFKTVGDKVSHAGIYIGNNQFIHAASDGPNTGVILSSLSETYWKQHYFAVGQVYTVLSRCTTMEGIHLLGEFKDSELLVNLDALEYCI